MRPWLDVTVGFLVVLLLAGLLLVTSPAGQALASTSGFPDVNESNSAHDAITYLATAGVVSGFDDGTFGPGKTLTRGQATKILVLWRGVSQSSSGPTFSDLDIVYRTYVVTAAAQGWISGFDDGTFRPYQTLTRQQMAVIMVRALGWEADALKLSAANIAAALAGFSDRGSITTQARPYVALAVKRGLFSGSNGALMPQNGITRGQFSLVVFRAELGLMSVIQGVRFASDYSDKTRVVLDLSRAPGAVTAAISTDGTLTVEYAGGAIAAAIDQGVGSPEIKSVGVRQSTVTARTVRITLKLARYQTFRVMSLAPSEGKGYRIVVDVFRRVDGPLGDGAPLICVDPGHGGSDSGAVGTMGTLEKDLNLSIALLLAQELRNAGLQVIMTRENDTLPALEKRAQIANDALASLFVSVHNNASGDPTAEGTECFYWGTPENYSTEGKLLAEAIQRNLVAAIGSKDRGARTHWYNLVVLAKTCMTAALAEVGFVTDPEEEAKLLTPAYQKAAAQGIAKGIFEYLKWSTTVYTSE